MPYVDYSVDDVEAERASRHVGDPVVAQRAGANRAAYPELAPGDTLATAKAGHGPSSPVTVEVARRRSKVKRKKKSRFAFIGKAVGGAAGAVRGGAGLVAEAVDIVTPEAVERRVGVGVSGTSTGVKGAARVAAGVAQGPAEQADAMVRDFARTVREEGWMQALITGGSPVRAAKEQPTTIGLAAERAVKGEPVDLGSGYFPAGEVAKEQARRARKVYSVDGHAGTLGRIVAREVFEPGSQPYRYLSGGIDLIQEVYDPTNVVLGSSTAARKAARSLQPTLKEAMVDGTRKTVLVDKAAQWADSADGARFWNELAKEGDFYRLMKRTGWKWDVEDVLAVSQMSDPNQVKDYLGPILGTSNAFREIPSLKRVPFSQPTVRRVRDARLWQDMPGQKWQLDDPNQFARTTDLYLRNANIRDEAIIAPLVEQAAKAAVSGTGADKMEVIQTTARVVEEVLVNHGAERQMAKQLTRLFPNTAEELRRFNITAVGEDAWFPGVKLDGLGQPTATPHSILEALNTSVPTGELRDIRRATSRYRNIIENKQGDLRLPISTALFLQEQMWKPAQLLRGAYIPRVVGEEQFRMAFSGFTSFMNHPLQALSWVVSDTSRAGRLLSKTGAELGTGRGDVYLEAFVDRMKVAPDPTEFQRSLYAGRPIDYTKRGKRVGTNDWVKVHRDHPDFERWWADEMMTIRADPVGSRVANGGLFDGDRSPSLRQGVDGVKDWLWEGTGRKMRRDLETMLGDNMRAQGYDPTTREAWDAYVDSWLPRIREKTMGIPELEEAVRTGRLAGAPIRGGKDINPDFVKQLANFHDVGPDYVKGHRELWLRGKTGSQVAEQWDRTLDWGMAQIMVKPSNYFSRSSTFRQAYWQRNQELITRATPEAQQRVIAAAEQWKLPKKQVEQLRQKAALGHGELQLDEIDVLAKGHAMDTTKQLLYDFGDKGQWSDVMRLFMPFAEAWKEVMVRWTKIAYENPRVLRRFQQVVTGARGAGWFQRDPTTGEEVFVYPGSELVSDFLLGTPVPFTGRVQGLSIGATILPGFGPVVQMPAGALLPDKPEWDWVRRGMLPFGETDVSGGLVESLFPAWVQKFRTAGLSPLGKSAEQKRQWNNAVYDMAAVLVASGSHSTDSPEAIDRLMSDATSRAKGLYAIRGFAQYFVPSAPSPRLLAQDKDGTFMVVRRLVEDYQEIQDRIRKEGGDSRDAVAEFIESHGEEALLFMQGKSEGGATPLANLAEWSRAHPGEVERHRDVYGFFGPQGGEFDIAFYGRQIRRGERKAIPPREAIERANARVASHRYRLAKTSVEGRNDDAAKAWLKDVREHLADAYPGYNPEAFDPGRIPALIRKIERASGDPVMARTDAGQAISRYLELRDSATAAARDIVARGRRLSGFQKAAGARHLRDWLRGHAEALISDHPDFSTVWEQVFEREMVDDTTVEEVA